MRWSVKALDDKGRYFNLVALKTNQGRPVLGGDVVTDASNDFDTLKANVDDFLKPNAERDQEHQRNSQRE